MTVESLETAQGTGEATEGVATGVEGNVGAGEVSPAAAGATEGTENSTEVSASAEAAAYQVNPEFTTFGEKKKFDEWALPFIKDADTEKKFRELFQAKYSIDRVKQKRDEYQSQSSELGQKYSGLERNVTRVMGYLEKGDLASFQRELNVPDDAILRRAQQILASHDNPALRDAEEQRYAAQAAQRELEEQNFQLQQAHTQTSVNQRSVELDTALSAPDVSQVAAQFDARAGREGAFRDEIIRRGQYYAFVSKGTDDRSVESLIKELVPIFGGNQQAPQVQAAAPVVSTPQAPVRKAVIPNVSGRASSPTKKVISSIDDLRARSRELASQNNNQ